MNYLRKTLPNGLNIFTVHVPDAQSVVFSIFVKVGSRYENEKNSGVAHFLEHVFFKGSQVYPMPTDMSSLIDSIGGDFNAATGKEFTEFYIRAEKHNFDLIFDVLTDMIQNPLFNLEEIEKEKGVVIEEINLYQDNPAVQVESNLEQSMWPNSPLGREVIGTKKTVQGLTRQMIFAFKETYYVPGNMILGIGGAFDQKKVLKKTQTQWGKLKNHKRPPFKKVRIAQNKPILDVRFKATQQAHLSLGFISYEHNNKKNAAALLLGSILGGSMSSRLFINIREQKGLAYYVRASNTPYLDTGNFVISAGLKTDKTVYALQNILAELRRLKTDLVPEAELKKSKDYIKGRVALSLEDSQEKLNWVVERFAFNGKIETPEEVFKRINDVTAEDLQKVANEIFTNKRMTLSVLGPFKNAKEFRQQLYLKENY